MSKQVDERVVEMRFDNKQFESATKESMSTLDKLKQKLKLKDATKGLNDLEKAAKKVDLNPLGKSAETITAKFSAMQVAGVTAISNLTNSAINAGKNITKALTIEPVITGFREYETQIGAIQTILANTQKEGTNVERVNAALDELNLYADQTIYNFTEMTRNIGTFTAAGVKLDDSVSAIKGIANLAAISGSTSQQASMAMYQLSQALAAGRVSLMDWNSVVNAGMGGQVFQDALIRTSENLKTGAKEAIATYGTFRESLTKGEWLTTEVLTETLSQLAGAYSEADLLAKGYSEEQAKEIVKLAETAKGAATDVKTFTQLWDTLKEAVQSGWGQTWRMIIGDFEQAKERMTKLSTLFGSIVEKSSNRRNSMLSGALDSNWSKLTTRLGDAGIKTEDFQNKIIELAKTHNVNLDEMIKKEGSFEKALKKAFSGGKLDKSILIDAIKSFTGGITESANAAKAASNQMEKYHEIADRVIRGDFGNGAERIEKLTKAGYEYAAVQNIVNEKLGSSVRHMSSLTDEQIKNADSLANLSDEQLKTKGYTEEQIIALKDLKKEADEAGSSIYKLINGFEKPSGVDLAWGSVFNIIDSITESLKAVKKAWTEIFHPGMTEDQIIAERSERLYKLLESIHAFTENLKVNEKTANKITRTFKGLFAILDIVRVLISRTFGVAFNIAKGILSAFNLDILDATAYIGDIVVKFRDWIKATLNFKKIFEPLAKLVKGFIEVIKDWFDEFKKSEEVQKLTEKIKEFGKAIRLDGSAADNFKKITEGLSALFTKLSLVLNASLLSGLKVLGAVLNLFGTNLANVAANIIDYLAKSKKWINENVLIANTVDEVAKILKTLIDGIKNSVKAFMALEPVQKFIENFKSSFASLFGVFSKLFSGFGIENFANGLAKAFESLQKWITSLSNSDNIGRDIILGLLNGLKVGAGNVISFIIQLGKNLLEAIKGVLGIHSPSTEGFDIGKNFILGIINGIKQMISNLLSLLKGIGQKCVDIISNIDFSKIFTLAISAGIIYSGKKIYDLVEKIAAPLEGLGKMFGGIGHMFNSVGKILDNFAGMIKVKKYEAIAKMFLNFGIAIGIMAASIYVLSNIEPAKLWTAVGAVTVLGVVMVALSLAMSNMSGAVASIGKDGVKISGIKTALISMGITLLLLAMTVKILGDLDPDRAKQGFFGLAGLVAAIGIVLLAFGKFVKGKQAQNIDKFGKMLMKLSISLLLLVAVIKLISGMSVGEIIKGVACIVAFGGIMTGLVALTNLAGKKIDKVGGTLLKMSAAMLLMVMVIKLISGMSVGEITKGVLCIVAFGGIMTGLVALTNLAGGNDISKIGSTLLKMSAAMILMVFTIKLVSGMSVGEIIKGVACIVAFGGIITGLVAATNLAGEGELKRVASTILAMSISIGILAAISVLLGLVDIATLKKGIAAVTVLGIIMAGMVRATKGAENVKGNIIAMTVAIGIMAASIAVLSFIDPTKLTGATVAIGMLMGIFAVMVKMAGQAQGGTAIAQLVVMTIAVGLLAGVIYVLTQLPIESVLSSASALSVLLLSMSVSLKILSMIGNNIGNAMIGIVGLLALCVPLAAFIGVLALMSNVGNAIENAIVLGSFTIVMTGVLAALTLIGTFGPAAIIGVGSLLALAVPLVAFVGVLALMQGIQNAEKNAIVLGSFTIVMTGVLAALTLIGALGPAAIIGVGSLVALVVALTGLTVALGALNEKFPQLETFLDSGISLLTRLAGGMGQVIGSFVSGLAEGLTSGLPDIATNLSLFMTNLTPFIVGAKMLDESTLSNVKTLISIMAALTGASLLESITSWFGGGGSSLVDFANQLVPFGVAMMAFSSTVTGINGEAITAAANAGKMMAEMAESIPREGGLWQKIAGEQDIADFGKKVIAFGSAIKEFSMSMSDFTINEEAITSAANAGKQMSELANKIPKSGGLWQKIAGEQDIADFGKKVTTFGKSIKKFASSIKGLTIDESAMESAINASIKMNEFSEEIPKSGGLWQKIAGEQDIADFGKKVAAFGTSIKKFITSVSGENDNIDSAVSSLIGLLRLLKNISDVNSDSIDAFKKSLENLGKTSVDDFIKSFDGADARAKTVISEFLNSLSKTVNDKKESLKSAFGKIGKYLVDGFCQGITENTFKAEAKARAMAKAAYDAAKNELDVNSPSKKFMKVGSSVVEGFAKGIIKNVGDVNDASVKMANGVLESTKNELGINSPSIVFKEEVGRYIVQGIAEGIKSDMSAEEAAEQKANNIINAFKKVIDSNNLDSDIAKNAFDIWSIGEGKYASDDVKDAKQLEYLTGQIPRDSKNVKLAHDKWKEMKANFGATNDKTKQAYIDYQNAITEQQNTLDAIKDISENATNRQNSIWDQEMANLDADYDLWESMYGDFVSEKTKNANLRSTLIKKVAIQDKKAEEASRKLLEIEELYTKDSLEYKAQREVVKNEKKAASDLRNQIRDIDKETRESIKESREIEQSIADTEYDTWLKTTGRNATEAEKDAKHLENLNSKLVRQNANLRDAEKEYEELCLRLGNDSAEAQKQLETVTQYRNDIATTNSEIYQITEDAIQREKDLLRERQDLASDTADLQYQIWEKIFGRDATDAEKDTVKLGTLNKQVIAQSNILAMTQKNLDEAIKTYGSDSVEAQRAYNEYLQEEYNLAQLHSDILDVEESIADREKRMQERQRNAKNDYLDYIKKYEKYYLEHGMTREELEKDAKLVSGYDPDKLINKTVSDVSKGVNKVINGHEYKNIITNFSNIGTDYATSISEGVSNGTPKVISSATTMVSDCVTTLNETQPSWISTGSYLLDGLTKGVKDASKKLNKTVLQVSDNAVFLLKLKYYDWCDAASYLVNGFIEGIRSRIWAAAQAAAEMARAALTAAEEALDINSPSKEFARVGAYAVMGMIEGLKDNTYLVADAATDVGDVAIDNLKNSIKRISDVVNSEIDTQPTIRPILDLSDVTSKASKLDAIVSRTQAMRINNEIARSNAQNIQNGTDSNASFGNTYQFTQNNYSPKELSSIEIYRRTKNQFAMMKMAKGMG